MCGSVYLNINLIKKNYKDSNIEGKNVVQRYQFSMEIFQRNEDQKL